MDVCSRLVFRLQGRSRKNLSELDSPVIVAAHDLFPSDTATLDRSKVLGIITEVGGFTSHSAIIARSYGIPAVLGVENALQELEDGVMCALNAQDGTVCVRPDDATVQACREIAQAHRRSVEESAAFLCRPACLSDGTRIEIGLNVGSAEDSPEYAFCDFVGLLRSEFLYMRSDHLPTEDEQTQAYLQVLQHANGKPVTLRTLDIGGDKSLPYLELPREDNPFLGKRALRLCLAEPDLFRTQLCAALRASAHGKLQLMFPMVGSIEDIRLAKAALEEAKRSLQARGLAYDREIKVGIMIEIPSIAMVAELAAQEVDFASVGTNDLAQYLHAADRTNAAVADYYQSTSAALFRTLERVFQAFREAGKPVSVCGELGGDPAAVLVMAGLGLRKTSMNGGCVARVKQVLSRYSLAQAEELAARVVKLPTQREIQVCLQEITARL